MSFDWSQYLNVAKELASQATVPYLLAIESCEFLEDAIASLKAKIAELFRAFSIA
jgi:hypothetical protein